MSAANSSLATIKNYASDWCCWGTSDATGGCCNRISKRSPRWPIQRPLRVWERQLKAKALENELQARSKAIERELALQEAAFSVITSTLETDLAVQLQLEETDEVIEPFAAPKDLPKGWAARREEILRARVAAASSKAAQEAAAKLRESFVAL